MIGKIFEIINQVKSDFRSAADSKNYYDEMQRFYKGAEDHDKNTFTEWYLEVIQRRLGDCWRKLRFKGGNTYAKIRNKVSHLRSNWRNGN